MNLILKGFATGLVAAVLMLPTGASAWTAKGADLVQTGETVLDISIGWPEIRAGVHVPIKEWFEIEPRLTFFYGWSVGENHFTALALGDTLGVKLKFNVLHRDRFDDSLEADPALVFIYPAIHQDKFGFGLQLGLPAATFSYKVIDQLWIMAGLDMPIAILFAPSPVGARIPFLFKFGVEWAIKDNLHLVAPIEIGPDIYAAGGSSFVGVAFNVSLGIAYRF